jgi:hypothetical protein
VAKVLRRDLSERLVDFLEIASYVFSADCATPRGKTWTDDNSTEPWERDLAFVIPVRDPTFWGAPKISRLIEEVLGFLSNDKYSFKFVALPRDRMDQPYFEFGDQKAWPFYGPERVLMFSGGLDSLAGAVEMARKGGKLVLVSHRPVSTIDARQSKLFAELQEKFPGQLIRIPVWINKDEKYGREPTQRTRSFLFSALGTLVAQSLQAGGVRFYENGVVSLNLPIAGEALRARASRTTHPIALHLLASLCTAVTEGSFAVDNPYLFMTKTEVVASLATHQAADLIRYTCSCAHSMFKRVTQGHCGYCSQCIDRRFAVTGAGVLAHDPPSDYASDVFVGSREKDVEKAIAVDYVRHGLELDRRSETELASIFNIEISRAVRYEAKRGEVAQKIIATHKRHGEVVQRVLADKIRENAPELVGGTLADTSLLALVIGQRYLSHRDALTPVEQERQEALIAPLAPTDSQAAALARMEAKLDDLRAKIDAKMPVGARRKKKKGAPTKRDTILFAAILKELEGEKYCIFLDDHKLKPKWADSGPGTYRASHLREGPWRKKVQDEKSRAKRRMGDHQASVLADSFNFHTPDEFHELSGYLTRATRAARVKDSASNPRENTGGNRDSYSQT